MTSPLQRKLKITGPTVVTANRLADGVVVWLTADGRWTETIGEAAVAGSSEAVDALLDVAHADENTAVGAYPARVDIAANGTPAPANLRERIRVGGPTVSLPGAA
ncbi:DUF2849 domain-containing protein [Xanthobacter dioxanivorans]|uniref:DUF2849 domain-containing protein n=1 Tax=Xanthobacter dioxanivorans TaxID=2528964 RepID=A0A974PJF1_9HYPH|nr:DUF2849 domain-containing protein [Xanthobacter dioxanivorans]QRG04742.1 DUF2849 domain-containing protein [Xanthobacter dioxanivorans]